MASHPLSPVARSDFLRFVPVPAHTGMMSSAMDSMGLPKVQHLCYTLSGGDMGTKHPRIHAVLEPPLFDAVQKLAAQAGVSLSQKVRDLVEDALELIEDSTLESLAEERRRTFDPKTALTVGQMRRRIRRR